MRQLINDLEAPHQLILRYARGDRTARARRDQLEGAVQIKFAIWRLLRRGRQNGTDP